MIPIRTSSAVALFLLATCAVAPARGGARDHDDGLLLRLSGGVGYGQSKFEDARVAGPSGDINFALGGIVSRNNALHGTVLGWVTSDPDVKVNGATVATVHGDFELSAVGVGLTHYFMPSNFYLSPTIGAGRLSLENNHTDIGLVTDLTLGKEWWTGSHWGLGLAGAVGFHMIPDGDSNGSWSAFTLGLRFSATMN